MKYYNLARAIHGSVKKNCSSHGNPSIGYGFQLLGSGRVMPHFDATKMLGGDLGTVRFTLPETNIAPENRPFQKEIHLPTMHFQVLC